MAWTSLGELLERALAQGSFSLAGNVPNFGGPVHDRRGGINAAPAPLSFGASSATAARDGRRSASAARMISVHRGRGARHERAGMADHVASEAVRGARRLRWVAAGETGGEIAGIETVAGCGGVDRHHH